MKSRVAFLLLALWLPFLAAQQAAFAHWAGHLVSVPAAGMESDHGETGSAAERFCAHCAALAALDSFAPGERMRAIPTLVAAQAGSSRFLDKKKDKTMEKKRKKNKKK